MSTSRQRRSTGLEYIRNTYDVPARRGQRVTWRMAPGRIVSAHSSLMSGRIVSVSFADDLMELDAARDLMEVVRRAITDPKYGHDGAWVRANILRRLDAFLA